MRELTAIDSNRFNDSAYIEARITGLPQPEQGSFRTALTYLYCDDGPVNLPRDRLLVAEPHLEVAECLVIRWLYTRTNGSLRSSYGAPALRAARKSRYRCEDCGFADVRALNIDHVHGRVAGTPFACLCANCHAIKSRKFDWTGESAGMGDDGLTRIGPDKNSLGLQPDGLATDNPWHRLPEQSPFVLPEDEAAVRAFNDTAPDDFKLRIDDLLPEPFVGNPNAPVILLGNNPGFTPEGARCKKEPRFVERMRHNLVHKSSSYPFVFFAPDIDEGHRVWWERKLKELLPLGRKTLADSILAVEHFPYPSRRYGGQRLGLPSRAQHYSFSLVRKAMERKAIIVLTRGNRRWFRALPALETYEGLCTLRNPQTATVSSENCDRFQEIVRAIENAVPSEPT